MTNARFQRLFVYGLLMRGNTSEPVKLLNQHASYICKATMMGKLYNVGDYPGAVKSRNPADIVHGEVYRVNDPDVLFPALDEYEECGPGFPSPTEYVRRRRRVYLINGRAVFAWVYFYNLSVERLERISDGYFRKQYRSSLFA